MKSPNWLSKILKEETVTSTNDRLAELCQEKEIKEGERVLRAERYFGKVSRSFQLAHEVDDAQSSAKFNEGILELTLPKRAASPNKRLTVE